MEFGSRGLGDQWVPSDIENMQQWVLQPPSIGPLLDSLEEECLGINLYLPLRVIGGLCLQIGMNHMVGVLEGEGTGQCLL